MSAGSPETFTLSWHKQSADSFARVLRRVAARAQTLTIDAHFSTEEAIHEVRLLIKRVRALLWFARPSLSPRVETEARAQLRKAAQLLSSHRDVKAAQTTFERMLKEIDSSRARAAVQKTTRILRDRNGVPEENSRQAIEKAIKVLCVELEDFARAVEQSAKWPSATKRTEKAFRLMCKTGKKARRTRTDSDFHAWRKKAKRLLFLLELRDADPTRCEKRLRERVDKLQETLGHDHDCVVAAKQLPAPASSRAVTKLLVERKRHLRKKSLKLARRIDDEV